MARYIDAELAESTFRDTYCQNCTKWCPSCDIDCVISDLDDIPTADVQEVKHGHWEGKADISFLFDEKEFYNALNERLNYRVNHTEDEYFEHFAPFICSNCGAKGYCTTPYCSECGAKMDEGVE